MFFLHDKKIPFIILFITAVLAEIGAQTSRPVVTNISAKSTDTDTIQITWDNPAEITADKLLIYRTEKPIASFSELSNLTPQAELSSSEISYTDKVKDYKEYYYTVLAVVDGEPYNLILPSLNATVSGVRIKYDTPDIISANQTASSKERLYPEGTMREIPLPMLDLMESNVGKEIPMSDKSLTAAQELAGSFTDKKPQPLSPYFFDCDMISASGGDDYLLFKILHETFARKNYTDSRTQLTEFLTIKRNKDTADRTIFYLAESNYYLGNLKEAIQNFSKVTDKYPDLAKKWINSSLDLMPSTKTE